MLKLEFPNESHREMYEDMMKEWRSFETTPTSPRRLFVGENYDDFLMEIRNDVENNQRWVNSTLFFLMNADIILWAIQIRHHIKHPDLRETGWHIGYGIRPSERQKWYATQMLKLWLEEAKKLWIKKVLISCDPDNIASEKVIVKNGWKYNKIVKNDKGVYKTFWIIL